MAAIKGIIFVIIGLFVSISSYALGKKGSANLQLFIYVGISFVAFGLIKMLIEAAGKPKKEKKTLHKPASASQNPRVKHCPVCRIKMPSYANFCFNCGRRM